MNRKFKNIIMIIVLVLAIVGTVFTIYFGKSHITTNNQNENIRQAEFSSPPAMNSENNSDENTDSNTSTGSSENTSNENSQMTPPEMNSNHIGKPNISLWYYVTLGTLSLIISLLIIYLIMSKFNKKTFKETFASTDKALIYILAILIMFPALFALDYKVLNNVVTNNTVNAQDEKETKASDIDSGTTVNDSKIDLSKYSTNITITKAGEYTLTGDFNNSILINADGKVTLNLDNVTIKSSITSAIANISENDLVINLTDNSKNTLSDGGSSEYDACIYSAGDLTIQGSGKLNVYGNQEEGEGIASEAKNITINGGSIYIESADDGINAGGDGGIITINDGSVVIKASGDGIDSNKSLVINGGTVYSAGSSQGGDAGVDTDDGFTINGGTVIAIGSDMLEAPTSNSKQYTICFNLSSAITKDTLVTLTNSDNEVITSFVANENFKTLIISSDKLKEGTYYLYTGGSNSGELSNNIYYSGDYNNGEKVSVGNTTEFKISSIVTNIK